MAKDWFNIRVKTEASKFNAVRSKIMGWPEEVAREVYWPRLEEIGNLGAEFIKNIIATDTNTKKYEQGGPPGRIDSKDMYNKVRSRARERKQGFSLFVGWNDGRPGYSIFQELGTKSGVQAMNSIQQSQEYMLSLLKSMATGTYTGSNTPSFDE